MYLGVKYCWYIVALISDDPICWLFIILHNNFIANRKPWRVMATQNIYTHILINFNLSKIFHGQCEPHFRSSTDCFIKSTTSDKILVSGSSIWRNFDGESSWLKPGHFSFKLAKNFILKEELMLQWRKTCSSLSRTLQVLHSLWSRGTFFIPS